MKDKVTTILENLFKNTTKEERLNTFEEIEKQFEQLKTETNYLYQNGLSIHKDFTVGELKKYLNRIPDDYIVCKTIITDEETYYSSAEVITVMQKQQYINFKGDDKEANIITIY